jgi:Tol biopolymer transport system component
VLNDVYYRVESLQPWMAVSKAGTAVYVPGNADKLSLAWVDREGNVTPASREQCAFWQAALSPDGTKALTVCGADLWIYDFAAGGRRRLTFNGDNGALVSSVLWSPDGKRVFYSSNEGGDVDIYVQPADGSRPGEVFLKRPEQQYPGSIAPDGTLIFGEVYATRAEALFTLSPDGKVSPFKATQFSNVNAVISPDGHWVAYQSDESGRHEIYVEAFPAGGRRSAVSVDGGITPVWSHDSKELFYVSALSVMAAKMRVDGTFEAGRKLFDRSPFFFKWHSWDAAPDGKRFLTMHRDTGSVPRQLNVILNWTSELERLVPRK